MYELLYQLKTKFDNFLVLYFLGVTAVGIFSVAVSFGALVLIVSSSISLILLKEMSSIKNFKSTDLKTILKKYIFLMSFITLLSIVFVYIIVHLFGENRFEKSFYVYCIYSINLLLFSIVTFYQSYFSSMKRTKIQLYSILISFFPYTFLFFINIENIFELILIIIFSNVLQCIYLYKYTSKIKNIE
jgi:O-antigen/teichoic acid export membrane protein